MLIMQSNKLADVYIYIYKKNSTCSKKKNVEIFHTQMCGFESNMKFWEMLNQFI